MGVTDSSKVKMEKSKTFTLVFPSHTSIKKESGIGEWGGEEIESRNEKRGGNEPIHEQRSGGRADGPGPDRDNFFSDVCPGNFSPDRANFFRDGSDLISEFRPGPHQIRFHFRF